MGLTPEEKRAIVEYITGWSVKPIFEDGVLEWDEERWSFVEEFLYECAGILKERFLQPENL